MSEFENRSHFEEGGSLEVHHEGSEIELNEGSEIELNHVAVDEKSDDTVESFTVIYEGPADAPLNQGLYDVEHEHAGSNSILLVPILTEASDKQHYQFVVSNLREVDSPKS